MWLFSLCCFNGPLNLELTKIPNLAYFFLPTNPASPANPSIVTLLPPPNSEQIGPPPSRFLSLSLPFPRSQLLLSTSTTTTNTSHHSLSLSHPQLCNNNNSYKPSPFRTPSFCRPRLAPLLSTQSPPRCDCILILDVRCCSDHVAKSASRLLESADGRYVNPNPPPLFFCLP